MKRPQFRILNLVAITAFAATCFCVASLLEVRGIAELAQVIAEVIWLLMPTIAFLTVCVRNARGYFIAATVVVYIWVVTGVSARIPFLSTGLPFVWGVQLLPMIYVTWRIYVKAASDDAEES